MDESLPATAAPADDTAAPAEPAPPAEKPARRRLHVPTSVVVTLLVAALSVWVAPAFTRQFEDRKQARQLQAQVAEQVAMATADLGQRVNSFANADYFAGGGIVRRQRQLQEISNRSQSLKDYWQVRQARIDAKLRAYFSPEMRSRWLSFNQVAEGAIELVRQSQAIATGARREVVLPKASVNLQEITRVGRTFGLELPFATSGRIGFGTLMGYEARPGDRQAAIRILVAWMRGIDDEIIARVMREDPAAYSTTRRDLFRDLLP